MDPPGSVWALPRNHAAGAKEEDYDKTSKEELMRIEKNNFILNLKTC